MGNIHLHRYHSQRYPAEDMLTMALRWYALAGRQEGGEPMIEQVRYWYVQGAAQGLKLDEAERFLREPEIGERYKRYGGTDIL